MRRRTENNVITTVLIILIGLCVWHPAAAKGGKSSSYDRMCIEGAHLISYRQLQKGVEVLNRAIKQKPACFSAYRQRGRAFMELRRYRSAVADYEQVCKMDPRNSYAWSERGFCLLQLGALKEGYKCILHAVELNPYDNKALQNLLRVSAKLNCEPQARKKIKFFRSPRHNAFSRAINLAPNDKTAARALPEFNSFLRAHPNDITARKMRAEHLRVLGRFRESLADYNHIIRRDPAEQSGYVGRAKTYARLKRIDDAIEDCTTALYIMPNKQDTLRLRSKLYTQEGRYRNAIEDYTSLIRMRSWNMESDFRHRGDCHFALKDYQKAIADYTRAIKANLTGDCKSTYLARARAYEHVGEKKKARADRVRANRK